MNKVLAIVVTYNRLEMLKECVLHLMRQSYPCDILIVDNASTDDTPSWCTKLTGSSGNSGGSEDKDAASGKAIYYENTGANLGGAGGFNYGMRRCVELGYEYAWVMDDDAFAQEDCLEELMKAASNLEEHLPTNNLDFQSDNVNKQKPELNAFGFLASAVMWTDGTLCRMNWQRKYYLPKKRSEHHICESDLGSEMIRIQSATFVSALFPVKIIKKVGLPIKEFFIWCDDIEYTRRIALKHSLLCYVIPSSRIVHHIKNNEGTNLATDDADRIPRYNYAFRNENFMYRQYGLKGFGYYLIVIIYNTFKVLAHSPDHKRERLKVIYKNLFSGLFFNPEIEFPE